MPLPAGKGRAVEGEAEKRGTSRWGLGCGCSRRDGRRSWQRGAGARRHLPSVRKRRASSGKGPGPTGGDDTAFHCWFLSQLGFNIRGGKASQLGIFISKVCLSFCRPLPVFCLFPRVLLSQLGVQGDCRTHLRTHSCNLPRTEQPSDGPTPSPGLSPAHGVLQPPAPHPPQSHGSAWDGHRGAGLRGRGAAALAVQSLLLALLFPSQVIPDSDAHRAGLQEGDQVLSVNDVDFQDIEHSKVSTPAAGGGIRWGIHAYTISLQPLSLHRLSWWHRITDTLLSPILSEQLFSAFRLWRS